MEKQDKKQTEETDEKLPSYDETMADKNNEQENANAPYVKFPHPINKHTAKRSSNKEFPGNQTLTYMNKK
ncbi:hypothetical protein AWRI3578_g3183 [Hanseniaspora opuntiae]|mgnify:FL=1|jgi:hypothetical protein|uniref:Uncharacterized protein n=1 Tax=Hanseniaspora opuntiae TaxID=211096 RepID=A0A1E5R8Z7_9ASCO|nr:hypothetical protein AWRI3578_g3183 [Hanseniaspora opuntiae]